MYLRKSKLVLLLFMAPIMMQAQTKPIIKIDLSAGVGLRSGNAGIILPAVYVPVQTHIDLGLNYNSLRITYGDKSSNQFFLGIITYKFPSFYVRINFSNNLKKVNPFIGYVLSLVKGEHRVTTTEQGYVGYNPYSQMSLSEQAKLEDALSKSEVAHGIQGGLEFKLFSAMSFFIKVMAFSLPGEKAFPFHYSSNAFSYNTQAYGIGGLIFKFYGSAANKNLIK